MKRVRVGRHQPGQDDAAKPVIGGRRIPSGHLGDDATFDVEYDIRGELCPTDPSFRCVPRDHLRDPSGVSPWSGEMRRW